MIDIAPESPEQSILLFVKGWMKLLAEGRLVEACALIDEPNSYGIVWTPSSICETVSKQFCPDTAFHESQPTAPNFTDPFKLEEQREIEVIEFADGSGYDFDYQVPLDGEWSDLTAQFEFLKRPQGYAVVLHDLHVL
ncbi:MAG TPA: hypothetical protein VIQ24_15600 [Pyrinomonadaceae bacterium]